MILLLLIVFIVVPIAELYVIIKVGEAIGVLPTIALLILDSFLGSWLLRSQGRAVWRRFNAAIAAGRVPAREVLDGVMVIFGGAFLITPGFITDVIGALLLLPPTRALIRAGLVRRLSHRISVRVATPGGRPPPPGAAPFPRADYDVEGTAVDVDPPHLRP